MGLIHFLVLKGIQLSKCLYVKYVKTPSGDIITHYTDEEEFQVTFVNGRKLNNKEEKSLLSSIVKYLKS